MNGSNIYEIFDTVFDFIFIVVLSTETDNSTVRTLVGNQIMITADVTNSQNTQQPFVYIT
jgi:hypothetical protein